MSEDLQKQLDNERANAKALIAQLDACKQMYNEQMNTVLQVRTNMNIIQQQMNQQNQDIANYKNQIQTLIEKINELQKSNKDIPENPHASH